MAVLETQEHYLILPNGRSKTGYGLTSEHRLHWIGQGSTAAPVIWLFISSLMLLSMGEWSKGVKWSTPQEDLTTQRYADSYVDNTTLWINGEADEEKLKQRMETDLTSYQEMLAWTGGALTLSKCFFSILAWEFTPDGLPQQSTQSHVLYIPRPPHEQRAIRQMTTSISCWPP